MRPNPILSSGVVLFVLMTGGCHTSGKITEPVVAPTSPIPTSEIHKPQGEFQYQAEQFADLRILRYRVPGFEELPLNSRKLLYFLSQAALSGRDITWDQNFHENLRIRHTLPGIAITLVSLVVFIASVRWLWPLFDLPALGVSP